MSDHKNKLSSLIDGDVSDSSDDLDLFSHDASMFELRPQLVVSPKNVQDVEKIIKYSAGSKKTHSDLSLTARSAGTDMSGGAITESILLNMKKYFTEIKSVNSSSAEVEPGVFYRDFEAETLKHDALMPSYPASRDYVQ